jgi:hypothetical protein
MLYVDGMDPQCMIGGHDSGIQLSSVYELSMGMPRIGIYDILQMLDFSQVSD